MSKRFTYYGSTTSLFPISPEAQAVVNNIETNSGEVCDNDERQRVNNIVDGFGGFSSIDGSHTHIDVLFHPLKTQAKSLAYWTRTGNAISVNSPTFISGVGFDLDGVNQYIDSGHDLSTSTHYSITHGLVGTYVTSNNNGTNKAWLLDVTDGVQSVSIIQKETINSWKLAINGASTSPNSDDNIFKPLNYYILHKPFNSTHRFTKNGLTIASNSSNGVAIPTGFNLVYGASNSSGTIANHYSGTLSGGVVGISTGFNQVTWNTLMQANIGSL